MAETKVRKTFGERPENVVVLSKVVEFDSEGIALVSDKDILETFKNIPGYVIEDEKTEEKKATASKASKKEEPKEEPKASEDEVEEKKEEKPKKPAPRKPSPRKPKK